MARQAARALALLGTTLGLLLAWVWAQQGQPLQLGPVTIQAPAWQGLLAFVPPAPQASDTLLAKLLSKPSPGGDSTAVDTATTTLQNPAQDTAALAERLQIINPVQEGQAALDPFFTALAALEQSKQGLLRIAHYGDSQIEGDRLTLYLRTQFHRRFAGKGLGFIPIDEPTSHHSIQRSLSSNWYRFTVFQNQYSKRQYGMAGVVFRYGQGKPLPDSATAQLPVDAIASYEFGPYVRFDSLKLMWGRTTTKSLVGVWDKDSLRWQDTLRGDGMFHITPLGVTPSSHRVVLHFTGPTPDIYGLLQDGSYGVQVDNMALRGHSGNGLAIMDAAYLGVQVRALGTKLFLFAYGANVVPYEVKDYTFFENALVQVLRHYQAIAPQASLLVIGVPDMSVKLSDASMASYPTVKLIRNAQKNAARRVGVAFWDTYAAMGGERAMVKWVNLGLAGTDYAHFTYAGQKVVAQWLFQALMKEYALFLNRQHELQLIAPPAPPVP